MIRWNRIKYLPNLLLLASLALSGRCLAEELESNEEVEPEFGVIVHDEPGPVSSTPVGPSLQLGARLDAAFVTGSAVAQGFSIPSMRLSAYGSVSSSVGFRLSAGQTKEFSSLTVPQLIPVEAFAEIGQREVFAAGDFTWRFGLFTPRMNPWWTPDLGQVPLPDYHETHRRLFLNRDIGMEASYQLSDSISVTLGAFNGNGVYGLSTNNSRAITGSIEWAARSIDSELRLGVGAFYATQSSQGTVNFRNDWVTDWYLLWVLRHTGVKLGVDYALGSFEDSTRISRPSSFGIFASWRASDWLGAFARAERASSLPQSGATLQHFQVGPELFFAESVRAFVLYQFLEQGTGSEHSALVRLRYVM